MTVTAAAAVVGTSRQVAARWLAEPETAQLVESLRVSTVAHARKRMHSAAARAVECLERAVEAGDWRAAVAILDRVGLHGRQAVEHSTDEWATKTVEELRARAERALEELRSLEASSAPR